MTADLTIRETTASEKSRIASLYPKAFPDEDLLPLVLALLDERQGVLSLAGYRAEGLVAHGLFTPCGVERCDGTGALLGPVGVLPSLQRLGLGGALIRAGLEQMTRRGVHQVFVLGDPGYYRRFGFEPERGVIAPYPLPEAWADAWQSVTLAGRLPLAEGHLSVPAPWMEPALWGP